MTGTSSKVLADRKAATHMPTDYLVCCHPRITSGFARIFTALR